MGVLGQVETKRVKLPSSKENDEHWVVVSVSITAGDLYSSKGDNNIQTTFNLLSKIIKEWNFTDETGKIAPITIENVQKLEMRDVLSIQEVVKVPQDELSSDKKKI